MLILANVDYLRGHVVYLVVCRLFLSLFCLSDVWQQSVDLAAFHIRGILVQKVQFCFDISVII